MFSRVKTWFSDLCRTFTDTEASQPSPHQTGTARDLKGKHVIVPVLERQGSQFLDEDGFRAHEFFVEDTRSHTLQRVPQSRLTPEGIVKLDKPALPPDGPVLLFHPPPA